MGKSKDVTEQLKSAILALVEGGRHKMNDIAQQVGVSKRTVQYIKKIGVIRNARLGKCGSKRATTVNTDRLIRRQALSNPQFCSHQISQNLHASGVTAVSFKTIIRRLSERGMIRIRPVPKPALTHKMRQKRLKWAKKYCDSTIEDWSKVCFSDELMFQCQSSTTAKV